MSRESLIFILGFFVFLMPFLGLPRSVKDIALIAIGMLVMLVGFMLRRSAYLRSIERASGERQSDAFAESPVESSAEKGLPIGEPIENV